MPNPFPGMNPWLETPAIWRDVHHRMITAMANALAPTLRPRYFVAVETHTYVSIAPTEPVVSRYPDIMVINRGGPAVAEAPMREATPYVTVPLPERESIEEGYLEVRLMPSGEVVTVIELLSHANKLREHARDAYLEKREAFLYSDAHFVEIDLLRAGPPMPHTERAGEAAYRLFIHRRERPSFARLYSFGVRQPIPTFPLPLLPEDAEPIVDLGALLDTVYDQAGYDLVLRYNQPATPPLSEADIQWAAERLAPPQ